MLTQAKQTRISKKFNCTRTFSNRATFERRKQKKIAQKTLEVRNTRIHRPNPLLLQPQLMFNFSRKKNTEGTKRKKERKRRRKKKKKKKKGTNRFGIFRP